MSRYSDHSDDDSPEAILAYGRWQHNARAALKGKRGRQALRELREALLALPERRLIEGAVCTAGDPDRRLPEFTDAELAEYRAGVVERWGEDRYTDGMVETHRAGRIRERQMLADHIAQQGAGVCAVGALLWHRKVQSGMDPAEAFGSVPDGLDDGSDGLGETASLAQKEAGLTYTLAWELAYRNDETYDRLTSEERWTAFVAWIDQELASEQVPA